MTTAEIANLLQDVADHKMSPVEAAVKLAEDRNTIAIGGFMTPIAGIHYPSTTIPDWV